MRTLLALLLFAPVAFADGPADNIPDKVRPVPPKGNPIPDADLAAIKKGLGELQQLIKDIGKHDLLPDVQIFEKAVRWAIEHDENFDPKPGKDAKNPPVAVAVKKALANGLERAKQLKAGESPWTRQTGAVLRGYKSKIDADVQPYWIIVPKEYDGADKAPARRLDFWWHGRFENVMEANFMANSPGVGGGIIPAPGAFIVHPYGRFSNANKFAGEIDTFEVLEHVKKNYKYIDDRRIVARGFSMGGAACWQYATHFPTLWCAAAPGAGFAETKEFLNNFQGEKVQPQWWEEKLWRMYDATEYAQNLYNLPTVAYSGENDKQKQAADIMVKYAKEVGIEFPHIIGKGAGHNYTPEAKKELNEKIDAIVAKGLPTDRKEIKFVTYTLRYNQCDRLTVTGLEKHWEKATVNGTRADLTITLATENVSKLRLVGLQSRKVVIDGTEVVGPGIKDNIPYWIFSKANGKWECVLKTSDTLTKSPGLQGPIDDAFMDSFLMVRPTGKPMNDAIGKWTEGEMKHAVTHWRQQFRGDAPVKDDKDVNDDDIKNNNLILWGDPKSNAILAKIADKLPLKEFGDTTVTALIYPNPLNPKKYVVLNSGFTYREYDYLNNARQVPKLPDYAVIDVTTPANSRFPGKITRAGFFDEQWKLQKDDGK